MKQILLALFASTAFAVTPTLEIKVDQVGYLSNATKVALVSSNTRATAFTLNRSKDGKVVLPGTLSAPAEDGDSGDQIQAANFSKWTAPGDYYIDVPGVGRSWDFKIGPDVYALTWQMAMRSFYGQRCGIAVDLAPEYPGYKHDACHLDGAFHASSGKTGPHPAAAGWHDGGDYGRYMVNSGIATGTLLWAYEMYGARLKDVKLDIPESGSPVPDMLSEIKWNLDWMLSMQDTDGGVWHKQTSETAGQFVMPDKDKLISLVIGTGKEPFKTTCATADFAAVMAIAGRVYQPFHPAYGNRSLAAAKRAWAWIEKNPNVVFHNPSGILTGEYGDAHCEDERLWAAAELFRSTGDAAYGKYFLDHYQAFRKTNDEAEPPSWNNVSSLAFWTYAQAKGAEPAAVNAIHHDVIGASDAIIKNSAYNNGYHISLNTRDYVVGSNGILANYGMQLLVADALVHNTRYRDEALEDLHYLLGRNTFSLSFVTRVGENPVRHPHHRPSAADTNEEPWPGLLAGGPNKGREDSVMRKLSRELPPGKMYVDEQDAWACNEVSIKWNAPLVFLLAGALDGTTVDAAKPPAKSTHKRF